MSNTPRNAADQGQDRVDRGQRVATRETHFTEAHDGKERARFVGPVERPLPQDMQGVSPGKAPTVEDVAEPAPTASAWEALERDETRPAEDRKGRDPASTRRKG
jgi:hypothetical protein